MKKVNRFRSHNMAVHQLLMWRGTLWSKSASADRPSPTSIPPPAGTAAAVAAAAATGAVVLVVLVLVLLTLLLLLVTGGLPLHLCCSLSLPLRCTGFSDFKQSRLASQFSI